MRKIKSWKGGRSERIYARITKDVKAKLLARVKREGYKSFGDWLEAQAMAKPNNSVQRTGLWSCLNCGDMNHDVFEKCQGCETARR